MLLFLLGNSRRVSLCLGGRDRRATLGGFLLVSLAVKADEEEEIGGQDGASEEGRAFGSGAVTHGGPAEIFGGKIRVRGKVDNEEVDDKLADLERCQSFLVPRLVSWEGRRGEIIVVHDDMDGQVGADWHPADRRSPA